ncbi:MAG: 16S rRNA (adenine(1518)-N(6)/adenine(1519)-N(6))-dimethyltransferase RsmA [Alphaproteobacteria bacterium]
MSDDLPKLRDLIRQHQLQPTKKLGQHFLLDQNLTDKIVRYAGDLSQTTVIEIGPGPGGLTRSLLQSNAKKVIAIERDNRCLPLLQPLLDHYSDRFKLVQADALQVAIEDHASGPMQIIANLPYNISTELLFHWMPIFPKIDQMILMFQKEVSNRLSAAPNSSSYGKLSVMIQAVAQVEDLFDVPAAAFTPPPKVVSTVSKIVPHKNPPAADLLKALEKITRAGFGQRRKMLRSSLKSLGIGKELLARVGVSETARAEDLSVETYLSLAGVWIASGESC